jgi:anti-sigma regulatory factor (Ser/Thr protein kinase)
MEVNAVAIEVTESSQVASARRAAVAAANAAGLDETEAGRAAIIATELATNLIKHGGGGELVIQRFRDESGSGFQCIALDKGRGMADLNACLRDGYSTTGSAGSGLGAVQRLSDAFDVFSRPGNGTAVLSRLLPGHQPAAPRKPPSWGGVCLPVKGEQECGDSWAIKQYGNTITILVADGLGHGPIAAEAAGAAVASFELNHQRPVEDIMNRLHDALRSTRGAAVAIARIDLAGKFVDYVGVGNIAGTLISGGTVRKMVSHNGTAGHVARKIQKFRYEYTGTPLVLMHSDGLQTSWGLDKYPGLMTRHPALMSAVLYRDFARGRDDVTVVAAGGA